MAVAATPSKTVLQKNFLIVLLCASFAIWFAYDGWKGWPTANNMAVKQIIEVRENRELVSPADFPAIRDWKGWENSTEAERDFVSKIITDKTKLNAKVKWHSALDIVVQKCIAAGLVVLSGVAIWWLLYCQERFARADENALTLTGNVRIPWSSIKTVDNTRWDKSGIVYVTYNDNGVDKKATLDEYHLDNLRPVLQELATRAETAEFVPPPEAAAK